MTKPYDVNVDGNIYKAGEELPDLGSWECTVPGPSEIDTGKRTYYGLSVDKDKLPKYDWLQTGSMAVCVDNNTALLYHAPTKTWYEQ